MEDQGFMVLDSMVDLVSSVPDSTEDQDSLALALGLDFTGVPSSVHSFIKSIKKVDL